MKVLSEVFAGQPPVRGTVPAQPDLDLAPVMYEDDGHVVEATPPPRRTERPAYDDYAYFRIVHQCPARQLSSLPSRGLEVDRHCIAIALCDSRELKLDRNLKQVPS